MQLETPIAYGRTSEIYDLGNNKVVKLFNKGWSQNSVNHEYDVCTKIADLGLAVPDVFELIEYGDRQGIVFEKIHGKSMLKSMQTKPLQVKRFGRQLADLLVSMNEKSIEGLPKQMDALKNSLNINRGLLTADEKSAITKHLDMLKEDTKLCHGDFHPDNVILTKNGPVVIDLITATSGNPLGDFSRSNLLMTIGSPPKSNILERTLMNIFRTRFTKSFHKRYKKIMHVDDDELGIWALPTFVHRLLNDHIGEEQEKLLIMIRSALAN